MEKIREDRRVLYSLRDAKKPYDTWSEAERTAADRVCRWFDVLGLLDSLKLLDRRIIDRFYAIPVVELWEICEPHVLSQLEIRGRSHFWELRQLVQQLQCVKKNHPAFSSTKWPWHPRKC